MDYDVEYQIFQYICSEADNYVPIQKLLFNNNLTFKQALCGVSAYRKNYSDMLAKYGINGRNTVLI